jgi:hypothetical protein|tara:strand:- start:8038 stop:8397 length:360 start_codon:yes stop_codon:yes gene_type:complete
MAIQWPASLQDKVNTGGYSLSLGDTVIRSKMDVGPVKTRRRNTRGVDDHAISIWVTGAEYTTLITFYKTTTAGGTLPFEFEHPITKVLTDFRFNGPPKFVPVGSNGIDFQVSMSWEELP